MIYKIYRDIRLIVLSSPEESELITASVVSAIDSSLSTLLEGHISTRVLYDNLDMVSLIIDEITEDGQVIETDPTEIIRKVNIRSDSVVDHLNMDTMEHTLTSALSLAKDQLFRSLRS